MSSNAAQSTQPPPTSDLARPLVVNNDNSDNNTSPQPQPQPQQDHARGHHRYIVPLDHAARVYSALAVKLVVPVTLTMCIIVWTVQTLGPVDNRNPTGTGTVVPVTTVAPAFVVVPESPGKSTGEKIGGALLNTLIVVAVITAITFLMVVLYKYGYAKLLYIWLGVAAAMVFFFLSAVFMDMTIARYQIPLDFVMGTIFVWNFGIVGLLSVFYMGHPMVSQAYLIVISVIVAWGLTQTPEWTTWCLLVGVAFYDIAAVLCPQGPLNLLVRAAEERKEPIPGFIYDSEAGPAMELHDMQQQQQRPQQQKPPQQTRDGANDSSSNNNNQLTVSKPLQAVSSTTITPNRSPRETAISVPSSSSSSPPTNPMADLDKATIHLDDVHHNNKNTRKKTEVNQPRPRQFDDDDDDDGLAGCLGSAPSSPASNIGEADINNVAPPADNLDALLGGGAPSSSSSVSAVNSSHKKNSNKEKEEQENTNKKKEDDAEEAKKKKSKKKDDKDDDEEEEEDPFEAAFHATPFKLGLGDFIFYSLLVARAANTYQSSQTPWLICYICIILGMGATLASLLFLRGKVPALPALPFSIFAATIAFFVTRYLTMPYWDFLTLHAYTP